MFTCNRMVQKRSDTEIRNMIAEEVSCVILEEFPAMMANLMVDIVT